MKIFNILKALAKKQPISKLRGFKAVGLSEAGTTTFELEKIRVYLVVINKWNSVTISPQGIYLIATHNASSITPIKESTSATLSINTLTLSVTTTTTNMRIALIPLSNIEGG